MFEFVFTQMTKTNMQSCNKFDFSMIFTIQNVIGGWPDKFQILLLQSLNFLTFRMLWLRLFHSVRADGKK